MLDETHWFAEHRQTDLIAPDEARFQADKFSLLPARGDDVALDSLRGEVGELAAVRPPCSSPGHPFNLPYAISGHASLGIALPALGIPFRRFVVPD